MAETDTEWQSRIKERALVRNQIILALIIWVLACIIAIIAVGGLPFV
jgi:hypothetical protein